MKVINILSIIIYPIVWGFLLFIPLLGFFIYNYLVDVEQITPSYRLFGTIYKTTNFSTPLYISTILYFISYIAVIVCFMYFNKIIEQFKERNIFHEKVILYFKRMGYLLCLSFAIKFIIMSSIKYIDNLFVKGNLLEVNNIFEMPIVILVFGLFFIILSKAFEIGKKQKEENIELKQENELTI